MSEFEIGGFRYRAGRIDVIRQFQVVRRLAPVIGSMAQDAGEAAAAPAPAPGTAAGSAPGSAPGADGLAAAPAGDGRMVTAIAEAVARMSDADAEYVLATCLAVVTREQPGGLGWTPVWNAAARRPQYDDINLLSLLQIVGRTLAANVGDFTSALPQSFRPGSAPSPAPGLVS